MTVDKKIKSIENGTNIPWDNWLEYLETHNYGGHTELAIEALRIINEYGESSNPEWWAQSVAIAYEQKMGYRIVGQRCEGDFFASASKTFIGNMDVTLKSWESYIKDLNEFNSVSFDGESRVTQTDKWRYWKINLSDGSMVNVNICNKPGGEKSTLGINHEKIDSESEREMWKKYWKEFLKNIKRG